MYVALVSFVIAVVHALLLYHWYVHDVVSHGSVALAVNVIVLHSFQLFVTLFAVGATLLTVHVALFAVTFPTPSFTYHVFVPLFGCVHPVLNVHVVVLFHVLPSKLYADELGIHPHPVPSLALVILKLHAVHSFTV